MNVMIMFCYGCNENDPEGKKKKKCWKTFYFAKLKQFFSLFKPFLLYLRLCPSHKCLKKPCDVIYGMGFMAKGFLFVMVSQIKDPCGPQVDSLALRHLVAVHLL